MLRNEAIYMVHMGRVKIRKKTSRFLLTVKKRNKIYLLVLYFVSCVFLRLAPKS